MRQLFSIVALASCACAQTASIQGIVASSVTGSALARVHVVLKNPTDNSGPEYGAQTTDDGRFSITGVPATRAYIIGGLTPGKYRVKAQSDGRDFMTKPEIMADGSLQLHDASSYYPGVLDARQAQRVEVKPATEVPESIFSSRACASCASAARSLIFRVRRERRTR
jgi:hypothetical protein